MSVTRRNPRACRGRETERPRIGLPRLAADVTEEKEPDDDDQHRKAEGMDGAGIRGHFGLTTVRIGRLGWHCARPRASPATQPRLYCGEFIHIKSNALLD